MKKMMSDEGRTGANTSSKMSQIAGEDNADMG